MVLTTANGNLFRGSSTREDENPPQVKSNMQEHVLTTLDPVRFDSGESPTGLTGDGGPAGHNHREGPGGYDSGLGCAVQCITCGKAYARGVNARLEVTTDTPAQIALSISGPSGIIGPFFSEVGQTSFSQLFTGLEPGTRIWESRQQRMRTAILLRHRVNSPRWFVM